MHVNYIWQDTLTLHGNNLAVTFNGKRGRYHWLTGVTSSLWGMQIRKPQGQYHCAILHCRWIICNDVIISRKYSSIRSHPLYVRANVRVDHTIQGMGLTGHEGHLRSSDFDGILQLWGTSEVFIIGKVAHKNGPQRAPPKSTPAPSTHPFVSVVGPHLKWSHQGRERTGWWHECRRGWCPSGPVFACALCLCVLLTCETREATNHLTVPYRHKNQSAYLSTQRLRGGCMWTLYQSRQSRQVCVMRTIFLYLVSLCPLCLTVAAWIQLL